MNKSIVSLVAAAGLALSAAPASAATYISGSLSFFGDFATLPAPPTASVVSGLTTYDIAPLAFAVGGAGDLAGQNGLAQAFSFVTTPAPDLAYITSGGFLFSITQVALDMVEPATCTATGCRDTLVLQIEGVVSGPGYLPTPFAGKWTANGVCRGTGAGCTAFVSASWSSSFTARPMPEPASLALLVLGLVGGAVASRRRLTRAAWD